MPFLNLKDRDFRVFVYKNGDEKPCVWIGRDTYKCGNCKKGYPKVKSTSDYEKSCDECGWIVATRWDPD